MDVITKTLVDIIQPNKTGGIFKYVSEVINGSCYSCLFQSSTWFKYLDGLYQKESSKSYISLLSVVFCVLVLLVLVILILIFIFIRRKDKLYYISTIPNFITFMFIVASLVLLSGLFQILVLAQTFNKEQSFNSITNKTFYSIELFSNQSLVEFPNKVNVSRLIDNALTQVSFTIQAIVATLLIDLRVANLLKDGPNLIENLISVNESFYKLYFYNQNYHQNVSKFVVEIEMFFHIISLLGESLFKDKNAYHRVKLLVEQQNLQKPQLNIKFDSSAFLKKMQEVTPEDISLQKIKLEIDKIIFDINKVVPDSLKDLEKDIPRDLILNKTQNIFKRMSQTAVTIHETFGNILITTNIYEPHLFRLEGFFIVWTTLLHFLCYSIFLVFVIQKKYQKRVHILNMLLSFLAVVIAILAIVFFVVFACGSNEVFRYFQQTNESLALDKIISRNSNNLWQNLLLIIKDISGEFWSILTLPNTLSNLILTDIRKNCVKNQSVLSILGFSSVFSFDHLEEIPMFKNLINDSRTKAKQKIVDEIKKISIPKVDSKFKDVAENALKKFLNEKEAGENVQKIVGIFNYFSWIQNTTSELETLFSQNNKIAKILMEKIKIELPEKIEIVKKALLSFQVIFSNSKLPEVFSIVFTQSQNSVSNIENVSMIQNLFGNIFDREIKKLIQQLFVVFNDFYQKKVLRNVASCSLFNNIFQNLSLYSTFSIALMSILFCIFLQTVIFLIFVIIFYGNFLKIICSEKF